MSLGELKHNLDRLRASRAELRLYWSRRRDTPEGTEAREVVDLLAAPIEKLTALVERMERQ